MEKIGKKGYFLSRIIILTAVLCFMSQSVRAAAETGLPVNTQIDTSKQFTITNIQPDLKNQTIAITFSSECSYEKLRNTLKVYPPVQLDWYRYAVSRQQRSFTVGGRFKPGQNYSIAISEDFECEGLKYQKSLVSFKMPDMESSIVFIEKGTVVERNGRQMIHANLTNVDEMLFQGLRVPPILIPLAFDFSRGLVSYEKSKAEYEQRLSAVKPVIDKNPALKEFSGEVFEERQLFFPGKEQNTRKPFSIPLGFRKDKERGAIEIVSLKSNKSGQSAETYTKTFLITDIGLTYKTSMDSLMIWATSLNTGKPLRDVSLLAVVGSAAVIPLGKTDKDGTLLVKNLSEKQIINLFPQNQLTDGSLSFHQIRFILAASQTDSSFIEINPAEYLRPEWVNQSQTVTTAGRKAIKVRKKIVRQAEEEEQTEQSQTTDAGGRFLKGHIFTERGIYRPGETVYFKGAVREYKNGAIIPPVDYEPALQIINAKGETVYDSKMKLSEFGTVSGNIVIKPYFPIGTYTINMNFPGYNQAGASRTFQVQEFQPPRHFTAIQFKREKKKDTKYINLDKEPPFLKSEISGTYYAGGPVKHGKVRWNIYYNATDFRKNNYKDFTFGNPREKREELIESGESMLDENGKITVNVPLNKDVASGLYGVEVIATIVDFDGKAASESAVYQEEPTYLVGIGKHKDSIKAGDQENLTVIVIDKDGKRLEKGKVSVEVMRKGYTYIRKRNEFGDVYWAGQEIWRKDIASTLAIENGSAAFDFDFVYGGEYLIKFAYQGSDGKTYISGARYHVEGYFYGYDYENKDRNFEKLSVSPEKSEYAPGETIRVAINPHKKLSSLLMTIEREGIIEYKTLEAGSGRKYIDISVKKNFAPNVYISFMGTVARGEFPVYNGELDNEAPAFLFGVANIGIKRERGELKVSVNENDAFLKAEPGAEVKLKLSAKDGSEAGVKTEIAVAVVDESVLAMTGFDTPSLENLAKFILPLSVFTGDQRSELLKQTPFGSINNDMLTGGDGLEKRQEAATSKVRKDFNPVAYFNPAVLTNEKGEATVSFKLPDTMTTYRVYAVACDKGSMFASTQRGLLAVKEFYLEPGTPRFFTKGDKFSMFVSAFNKTDKSAPMSFSLGKDSLVALSASSLNYQVKSMDSTLIPVEGTAIKPGISKLIFSGQMNGKSDAVEMSVPVNSGYIIMNDVVFGTVTNGAKIRYQFPQGTEKINWTDLRPEEVKAYLTISGSPFLRMSQGLKYLLHYPYGCVEQTSSGVLPLAGLRGLIKEGLIPDMKLEETDKFLKPGITRLLSMQTDSGGFAYWPGNLHPDQWGTIYAVTALTHAKLAGFDVPLDQMNLALNYLKTVMEETAVKKIDRPEAGKSFAGFAAYLLALNGALDQAAFKEVYQTINDMPREGSLLTLLAAKINGYLPEAELINAARPLLERRWIDKSGDYYFYARYREPAIALITANTILPRDPMTGNLANELLGGVNKEGIWTSTSDTGWSLVALGEYFKGVAFADKPVKVSIRQEGWPVAAITIDSKKSYTYAFEPASFLKKPEISIFVEGNINMVYSLSLSYPRVDYALEGYERGFKIHKSIENTDGSKAIKVGDVVKVTLDIDIEGNNFNYIVLDDPLPAGFVAINSAIKTEEHVAKKKKKQVNDEGEYYEEGGEDYYWSAWNYKGGFYNFIPNYFEIRDDRVLVFKDRSWKGRYRYSYYVRAVCKGEFVLPSTKIQLMYEPNVVSYTAVGKVVVDGR